MIADCRDDEGVCGEKRLSRRWRDGAARLSVRTAGADDNCWRDRQCQRPAQRLCTAADWQDTSTCTTMMLARALLTKFCHPKMFDLLINIHVAKCWIQKVPKYDFSHFRSSEQHANGTNWLASCDFLLVFYKDVRSRWNGCRVIRC